VVSAFWVTIRPGDFRFDWKARPIRIRRRGRSAIFNGLVGPLKFYLAMFFLKSYRVLPILKGILLLLKFLI